ncbi:MAG: T9SS type A sorting domain-containing protein [Paludibacteraceae bacterium]|nr:T9SS type A sorting domain-containing protein [Paludibacteraceae bacterium]
MKNLCKLIISLMAALWGGLSGLSAQNIPVQINNTWYNLDYDNVPEICMPLQDTIVATIDVDWEQDNMVNYHTWTLQGDLQYATGYSASSFPTVKVVSPLNGYGKGRITYRYRNTGCSSGVHFDVFKSFALPEGLEIKGPECVVTGEDVVYSITPLVTKNLNHQIGIDTYYWNILENTPSFVDEILYVSGDGSSITFKVGTVTDNMQIVAGIGQCNEDRISKTLGKATPRPEFESDTMLVPYGTEPFRIGLKNAQSNINYTWRCNNGNFELLQTTGDTITIQPKVSISDIKGAECDLIVTAKYINNSCDTTETKVHIARMWGHVTISPEVSCVAVGDTLEFTVAGDIPSSNTKCSWTYPAHWGGRVSADNTQTIRIAPTEYAALKDTLWVRSANPSDTTKSVFAVVHVKPAQITEIESSPCLTIGELQTFTIDTVGLLPHAKSFHWVIDATVTFTGEGTTSVSFVPTGGTTALSVTPIGEDDCNGETYTQYLALPPQQPDSIRSKDTCLFSGKALDVELSIKTPKAGQTYHWSRLNNWTISSDLPDSSIVTYHTTNAWQGNYPVSAWATTADACGNSASVNYTIRVDTMDWSIDVGDLMGLGYGIRLKKGSNFITNISDASWHIEAENGRVEEKTMPFVLWSFGDYGYGELSSVTVTFMYNGCEHTLYWPTTPANVPQRQLSVNYNIKEFIDKIYPNPVNDIVTIRLKAKKDYLLAIIDNTGKLVKHMILQDTINDINVSDLIPGNYTFIISDHVNYDSHKIIITH